MARFRYRMQSILDIKEKIENQARQELASARLKADEEREKLEGLKNKKTDYEKQAAALLQGTLDFQEIEFVKAAILKTDEYITLQTDAVRLADRKVEAARSRLQEVMQERKMHEKLKEHAFEAFLEDEKKQEGKEVDELTSYTYGQKRKA